MSDWKVTLLVIATAIAITYFIFSVWNVFITKKQITIAPIDFTFWNAFGILCGLELYTYYGIKTIVSIALICALWLSLIAYQTGENEKEKIF